MNEYEKWSKIKFIVSVDDGWYTIRSVDFGAIPVSIISPISRGITVAKKKTLRILNEYNKTLRWTEETVGDKSIIDEVEQEGQKLYKFKPNTLKDLKFIDNGEESDSSE